MRITVKCFATLCKYSPRPEAGAAGEFEAPEGADVARVMEELEVPRDEVAIIFVNGRHAAPDTSLNENDVVGLFPAVGGG